MSTLYLSGWPVFYRTSNISDCCNEVHCEVVNASMAGMFNHADIFQFIINCLNYRLFPAKVSSSIRSIFKSDVLRESDVLYCERYANGGSVDLYNLETVTILAFRIHSPNADRFRAWLIKAPITDIRW